MASQIHRPVPSHMWFVRHERPKYLQAHPEAKFTEVGKALGRAWATLPVEEKRKYNYMAIQDTQRYRREMSLLRESIIEVQESERIQRVLHTAIEIDKALSKVRSTDIVQAVQAFIEGPTSVAVFRKNLLKNSTKEHQATFVCALSVLVRDDALDVGVRRNIDKAFRHHSSVGNKRRKEFPSVTHYTLQKAADEYCASRVGIDNNKRQKK